MQGRFSPPCEIFISSTTSLVLRDLTPTFDKEPIKINFVKGSLKYNFLSDCRQSPLFQADFCYVEACKPDKKLVQ